MFETAESSFGKLDGLVNNAAIDPRSTIVETNQELFDRVFEVNTRGPFFCTRYAIEAMPEGGSIVNIGSTHGYDGEIDLAAYACSKGALRTLTQHVAKNYASQNIRCNWITVGWVITDNMVKRMARDGYERESIERLGRERVPLGRMQTDLEIAAAVEYLLSDDAAMVTGTELQVTGGFVPSAGVVTE